MRKYFSNNLICDSVFKNIPACILGIAVIFSLICAMNSYMGIRGIVLNTSLIIIGVIFFEILLLIINSRLIYIDERKVDVIIVVELAVLGVGLVISGFFIQSNSLYDLEHMHMSAMSYADTGNWGHSLYFSRFPMQRNWTVFLGLVYVLEKALGITDYRIGGIIVGIILTFIMVCFSGKIMRVLFGKKIEAMALLFLLLNPTFYLFVSFYYKDIPGPMCEVLVLYLVLKGSGKKNRKYYVIAGIIAGIGCFILQSVGIGLIAAGMYIIFGNESYKIRKILIIGGVFISVLCLLNFGIDFFYEWDLDENKKFPLAAWILTGLYGKGTNCSEINNYVNSFLTLEEKTDASIAKIIEVVKESRFSGMLQLWISKQCTIFSNGLSGIVDFSNYVGDYNSLWRYSIGPKRLFIEYYAQIYRCVVLMNCLGAIVQVMRNKFDKIYLLFVCVFGHVLWHSFFETKDKYLLTFLPVLIVFSTIGFNELSKKVNIASKEHIAIISDEINAKMKFRLIKRLCVILSLLSLLIYFSSFKSLFRDINDETAMRAANKGYYMSTLALSDKKAIGQTFRSRQSFNSVELHFNVDGADENVGYKFELLDSDDKIITHTQFDISQISNGYIQFDFDEIIPDGWEYYTICVSALNESDSYISIYGTLTEGEDDFYNYGEAIGTDGYMNDLYFVVNEKYYDVPYYPMRVFFLSLGILLFVESIPIVCIWKYSKRSL